MENLILVFLSILLIIIGIVRLYKNKDEISSASDFVSILSIWTGFITIISIIFII